MKEVKWRMYVTKNRIPFVFVEGGEMEDTKSVLVIQLS